MAPTSIPDSSVAKSGWLMRRSKFLIFYGNFISKKLRLGTVLHRWKRAWFILFRNGRLGFYEDQNSSSAEEMVDIPYEKAIVVGPEYVSELF